MSFIATTDMYIEMRNKRDLVEDKLHDMTKQRNSLIDDIAVLKENISRLEKIRNIKDSSLKGADIKIKTLERENEQLRKTLIKTQNLADELMEYQVKYITLTDHIRLKAEMNPSVSRYIDLVNYVDRLEKGEK
ncbi:hypothetical protein ACTRV7_04915 [Staphylococcus xylosus]|uniref:hypothetical protein n=1 Tax=Staphylococcus xylosus TaxID=1288 RepID=UPI003F96230E